MKRGGTIKILRLMMISVLLVALTVASGEKEAVLDFLGRPVLMGLAYLIRVDYGKFIDEGWINHSLTASRASCPEYVTIDEDIPDYVVFEYVPHSYIQELRVSTEVSIYVRLNQSCWQSPYWGFGGGHVRIWGNPLLKTSKFTIEKYGGSYRLASGGTEIGVTLYDGSLVLSSEVPPPSYFRRLNVSFAR